MEARVNYARVGLFVVLLGAALVAMIVWLGKGASRRDFNYYHVYVRESVTGLNVNASVKYLGVNVGYLKELAVDPEDPAQVRLTLAISLDAPVKEDTVAYLEFQGLTGIALVNLTGGGRASPPLTVRPGERYPVIKNVPSLYARLNEGLQHLLSNPTLPQLAANLNGLAADSRSLVDEENRAAFRRLLAETGKIAGSLDRMTGAAEARLPAMLDHLQESARSLREMSSEAAEASAAVKRLVDQNRAGVEAFTGQTLTESALLIAELRQLTASSKRLVSQLEREPNALIFGQSRRPTGPGE